MIPDVNWLLSKSTTELRNVCNRNVVERPQGIFVQGRVALYEPDFDAGC